MRKISGSCDQSAQVAGGWIFQLTGVDADGVWRALLMVAKEPKQFNCECDTVYVGMYSLRRTVNTHLNEV